LTGSGGAAHRAGRKKRGRGAGRRRKNSRRLRGEAQVQEPAFVACSSEAGRRGGRGWGRTWGVDNSRIFAMNKGVTRAFHGGDRMQSPPRVLSLWNRAWFRGRCAKTVANFVKLVGVRFLRGDGLGFPPGDRRFHWAQGGCPNNPRRCGAAAPENRWPRFTRLDCEINSAKAPGPGSFVDGPNCVKTPAVGQFFLCHDAQPHLDGGFTPFRSGSPDCGRGVAWRSRKGPPKINKGDDSGLTCWPWPGGCQSESLFHQASGRNPPGAGATGGLALPAVPQRAPLGSKVALGWTAALAVRG